MESFVPGLELAEAFYREAVRPVLDSRFPGLVHSAARLDSGSDILGFDTPQSMDHGWGPKTTLFLSDADCARFAQPIIETLANELPCEIRGIPTNFSEPNIGCACLQPAREGPVCHAVTVTSVRGFFGEYVGFDPLSGISEVDWLLIPQQRLRTVASGKVFHDGLGELAPARKALEWYPKDVWLYLLACQWQRINQEEPFMARCGDVGDELGSRIVAARLVDYLMKLCFLMERKYWPYYKWFGTAFSRLECARVLEPIFQKVFNSCDWKAREEHLSSAYIHVSRMHNHLGITEFIEPAISPFHNRPYQVPHSGRFVEALRAQIKSDVVLKWPAYVGAAGQFTDSTNVMDSPRICKRLRAVYGEEALSRKHEKEESTK